MGDLVFLPPPSPFSLSRRLILSRLLHGEWIRELRRYKRAITRSYRVVRSAEFVLEHRRFS